MFTPEFIRGFVAGVICCMVLVILLICAFTLLKPWIRLKTSCGGNGTIWWVLGMRLRGTPYLLVIDAYATLLHAGVDIAPVTVETKYIANKDKIHNSADLVELVREHLRQEEKEKA